MYINPYLTILYLNYGLHFIERIVYFNKNLLFVCENAVIFSLNENFYGFQRIFPHLKIYKIYEKSKNKFAFKYIYSFFFLYILLKHISVCMLCGSIECGSIAVAMSIISYISNIV